MCGISGWINFSSNLQNNIPIIEQMTHCMQHRGPDASGFYLSEHVLLGHRRLSIIDPENGAQPMIINHYDNTYVIVYNGELYNTDEVRYQLLRCGHTFETRCDTEVLLRAYIEYGENCLKHINGIFAFAIYDLRKQKIFLARDPFGVKPLFFVEKENTFLFASEIKSILKNPLVSKVVKNDGLAELLFIGPARTSGFGIYNDIQELSPGHFINYDGQVNIKQYFSITAKPHTDSIPQTISKVREILSDSIKRQLVSDVPLGTFLSGGLDSSIITAIAAIEYKRKGQELKTFSLEFEDNQKHFSSGAFQDSLDTYWINQMREQYDTDHYNILLDTAQMYSSDEHVNYSNEKLDENVYNSLLNSMLGRDLPGMTDIDSSLLSFCKEVRNHLTVGISGECADEVFGGYPWYYAPGFDFQNNFPWNRNFDMRKNIINRDLLSKLHADEFVKWRLDSCLNNVPFLPEDTEDVKKKRQLTYLNLYYFMSNLLERKDRMSMACGLEVRVPFCDIRLVEYVYNIPWEIKFLNNQEKGLLRKAFEDILPKSITERKKNPYPKTYNPAYDASIRRILSNILKNTNSKIIPLIDVSAVSNLLQDKNSASSPWFGQLMDLTRIFAYLIQFEQWLNHYQVEIIV